MKRFATTRWSVVLAAGMRGGDARAALDELCRAYWQPLYGFARRERAGRSHEEAESLTQGFLADLLGREDLGKLDPARGSFRSWLLQAMRNFIARTANAEHAQKRGGGMWPRSIDERDEDGRPLCEPAEELDPDRLFHRRWAMTAVRRAMARVQEDVAAGGPDAARIFERLKDRIVDPGEDGYDALAAELGVTAVALRKRVSRWRRLVRDEVADTLQIDAHVDAELEELINAL